MPFQPYGNYKLDKMIYVNIDQQGLHTAQLFKIISLIGIPFTDMLEYVNCGLANGKRIALNPD